MPVFSSALSLTRPRNLFVLTLAYNNHRQSHSHANQNNPLWSSSAIDTLHFFFTLCLAGSVCPPRAVLASKPYGPAHDLTSPIRRPSDLLESLLCVRSPRTHTPAARSATNPVPPHRTAPQALLASFLSHGRRLQSQGGQEVPASDLRELAGMT